MPEILANRNPFLQIESLDFGSAQRLAKSKLLKTNRFAGTSADAVSADHRSLQVISLCSGWQIESEVEGPRDDSGFLST